MSDARRPAVPPHQDERVRGLLVIYTTVQSLALIIFFGAAPFLRFHIKPQEAMGVVQLVLPLFTGYLGLILGYYFGTKEHDG